MLMWLKRPDMRPKAGRLWVNQCFCINMEVPMCGLLCWSQLFRCQASFLHIGAGVQKDMCCSLVTNSSERSMHAFHFIEAYWFQKEQNLFPLTYLMSLLVKT